MILKFDKYRVMASISHYGSNYGITFDIMGQNLGNFGIVFWEEVNKKGLNLNLLGTKEVVEKSLAILELHFGESLKTKLEKLGVSEENVKRILSSNGIDI